ncbi:hypothetical protein KID03_09895 [bacterium]|uniref:Uncharacterized protein n=1 Tax=Candidatus Scatenecus faecavium TaxID=2840915 RepID=A0A9D1K440_9BACT|nr:hypothetical protein [bacterium]HIS83422.1 hypothetical protein [Candidatus Scatenecus faecavium]
MDVFTAVQGYLHQKLLIQNIKTQLTKLKKIYNEIAPKKYENLLKEETKLKFYDSKMIFWGEALRTLNDSLKNEQIRMKMINDSIKSAAKHIK